ncbi:hypothetical protein [Methylorubrum extorquens]|uniref:hypothetical protein n=1 Tax=Methylorubrum extorquens TaxID=408 RepID=UPI0012DB0F59|nr:hypothetical protein [Methylorubrum extorquens]
MEIFDRLWYAKQVGDGVKSSDMIGHYCRTGKFRGFDPSPYFDTDWYVAASGIALDKVENPLAHCIEVGGASLCDPHPLFNAKWYRWTYMTGEAENLSPLIHYFTMGRQKGARPHPLFWGSWYRQRYISNNKDIDPFYHFLTEGERSGLNPNPLFDVKWYRERYHIPAAENTLTNYVYGGHQTRDPHVMFNSAYYRSMVPCEAFSPLEHYLTMRTDIDPCILFDAEYFSHQYEEVFLEKVSATTPLFVQYLESSEVRDIDPHPLFSKKYYIERYRDVKSSRTDPFEHYMRVGYREKRQPHALFEPDYYLDLRLAVRESNPLVRSLTTGIVRMLLRAGPGPRIRRRKKG